MATYYNEVKKARRTINELIAKLRPGDEVPVAGIVLVVVERFEVGEKLVRSHLKLLDETDKSIELTERTLRKV